MVIKPKTVKKVSEIPKATKERYFQAKGGRKTAEAIARVYAKKGEILVNQKSVSNYFKNILNQLKVKAPFDLLSIADRASATVKVSGGGLNAQAEAVRNALARALVKMDETFRKKLRLAGFLTRDARMVERKKYGLKKARRAPQWAKR